MSIAEPAKDPGADLTDEVFRVYTFPTGTVRVDQPQRLWVKRSERGDSHRIETLAGGVYIPAGWIKIEWTAKPGKQKVAF